MSDESPTKDSADEFGPAGPPSAFSAGRQQDTQIGQDAPDIELLDDDGNAPPVGRSTYSARTAASKDAGVQLPDERLEQLAAEHDEALRALEQLKREYEELQRSAEDRVDGEALSAITAERDLLANEVTRLKEIEKAAVKDGKKLSQAEAADEKLKGEFAQLADEVKQLRVLEKAARQEQAKLAALTKERDALREDLAGLREVEKTGKQDAEKLAALTKEHDDNVASRQKLQADFAELRRIVDERVTPENHKTVVEERDNLTKERDRLAVELQKAEREVELIQDRSSAQLTKLEADRDRQVAALDHQRDEFAQLRRVAEARVEAEAHQAVVNERDALSEQSAALEEKVAELGPAADAGARDAQALAKLTEEHRALIDAHQKLTESFQALHRKAETMVDSDTHTELVKERDVLAEEQEVLVGEVKRLRAIEEAGRVESEKLAALADEHGRQMDAFDKLKKEFKDLKRSTEEWVDVDKFTEMASQRDALVRDRDQLLAEVKKLQGSGNAGPTATRELSALKDEHERQVATYRKLQSDFDTYRKDTALERAAAKRAGISLSDYADESDADALLAQQHAAAAEMGASGEELEALAKERDEYLDGLRRLQAEFENFRKRTARDRKAEGTRSARQLMEEVLPVMDNLGLASAALTDSESDQATGVEMVLGQLRGVFASRGCQLIEVKEGDSFDPEYHEAVQAIPSDDFPEGSVVSVIQPGYRLEDGTLLRPVRVVVSAASNGG